MYMASLRKVGGSVMLAVPPPILEMLGMACGTSVSMEVEAGRLVISPGSSEKYELADLLAQCDPDMFQSEIDNDWLEGTARGRELI